MKTLRIKKQYEEIASVFSNTHEDQNWVNRAVLYEVLSKDIKNKKILDLGCGDGKDMNYYSKLGAVVYGVDMSLEFIKMAKINNPSFSENIKLFDFEKVKFPDKIFDLVVSKYAIQTSKNIGKVFSEAHRLLKKNGYFILLVTHPLRQYIERRGKNKNYFKTKIVDSVLFNGSLTVKEPTHTFYEYFSPEILSKFNLELFDERYDPAAEKIDGDTYPGFMIMKFKKK